MDPQKPPEDREAFVGKEESEEAGGEEEAPGPLIFIYVPGGGGLPCLRCRPPGDNRLFEMR